MQFEEYRKFCETTCLPQCRNEPYLINGLISEIGEFADKVKKLTIRDGKNTPLDIHGPLVGELGDIMWYTAMLANFYGAGYYHIHYNTKREKLTHEDFSSVLLSELINFSIYPF